MLLIGPRAWAAIDESALIALGSAVTAALAAEPDPGVYLPEHRRASLLPLAEGVAALVVAKPGASDCAIYQLRKQAQCRAFLMQQGSGGRWTPMLSLDLPLFPVAFSVSGGTVRRLWISRSRTAPASYRVYDLSPEGVRARDEELSEQQMRAHAHWEMDDRNMSPLPRIQALLADRPQSAGRLAPVRILSDSINTRRDDSALLSPADRATMDALRKRYRLLPDGAPDKESIREQFSQVLPAAVRRAEAWESAILRGLAGDQGALARGQGWPQLLDVRVRNCTDWMVPREFWLTESRRLGQPGLCTDAIVWASAQGLVRHEAERMQLARLYLYQDIAAAYLTRVLALPLHEKQTLLLPENNATLAQLMGGLGALLAHRLGTQSASDRLAAHALDRQIAARWIDEVEVKETGFIEATPELKRYLALQRHREAGARCALALTQRRPAPDGTCQVAILPILRQAQESLE